MRHTPSPFLLLAAGTLTCVLIVWVIRRVTARPLPRSQSRPRRSAAQIAYEQDPEAVASCVHLQPVERAMRRAGIAVRLLEVSEYAPVISAGCRIHEAELRRLFLLPPSILYQEGYQPERSPRDNPRADLICGECLHVDRAHCDILVVHPEEGSAAVPWFPSPP